jgi:hypothetical protein
VKYEHGAHGTTPENEEIKYLSQCYFVHYSSKMNWPRIEPKLSQWKVGD